MRANAELQLRTAEKEVESLRRKLSDASFTDKDRLFRSGSDRREYLGKGEASRRIRPASAGPREGGSVGALSEFVERPSSAGERVILYWEDLGVVCVCCSCRAQSSALALPGH